MKKELRFSGDELGLLVALDRTGCVLTDDGKFYCDLENGKLAMRNRLPARIRGEYTPGEQGWILSYRVLPAPKTVLIGVIVAVLLTANLITRAASGESLTGSFFFAILLGALAVNYAAQYKECVKQFENQLTK